MASRPAARGALRVNQACSGFEKSDDVLASRYGTRDETGGPTRSTPRGVVGMLVTVASTSPSAGKKPKRPQGNWLVLRILHSRLHRLLDGSTIELGYTGRRSGTAYTLPLQYARAGDRLVLAPQGAQAKMWWRNFMTPRPVTVRLRGHVHDATAQVVRPGDASWEADRAMYATRWKRQEIPLDGPLVRVSLEPSRPSPDRSLR